MRQIRTPDGIWNLPETINTEDPAWLKLVNEALKIWSAGQHIGSC